MPTTHERSEATVPNQAALDRARAFQAAAVKHCNEEGITAGKLIANPDGILPFLGRDHGLVVRAIATGEHPVKTAVMLVADGRNAPWPVVGLLVITDYGEGEPDQLSFYPADRYAGPNPHDS